MNDSTWPWHVGQSLPSRTFPPVGRLDLIKYAGASGDFNPIHTIDDAAAAAGLPGLIQHGMLTMARVGALFSPYLDRGFVQRFESRFVRMVELGDVLTVSGTITAREHGDAGDLYLCEVVASNQKELVVATGTVGFLTFGHD